MRKKIKEHESFISSINYGYSIINKENFDELDKQGYTILRTNLNYWKKNNIDFEKLSETTDKLCKMEGKSGGWENGKSKEKNWEPSAQRISNLPNKDKVFIKVSMLPDLIKGVNYVIKNPFKLSSMQIRNPIPFGEKQEMHIDWRPRLFNYFNFNQCTAFIYLDDANEENGSLNIYPGTHKLLGNPNFELIKTKKLKKVILNVKKYNILILNIFTWHYGGKNLNGKKRRTIFSNYRERSEWQQLNQKRFLDKNVIDNMDYKLKYLYAVRAEDKNESQWFYKYRNNYLLKGYQKTRDIFYHKYLNYFNKK